MPARGLQPLLHELVTCLRAPTVVLSAADGQIHPGGAQGVFSADRRVLSRASVHVNGKEPEFLSWTQPGTDRAAFTSAVRSTHDPSSDVAVWLHRERQVTAHGLIETLTLV